MAAEEDVPPLEDMSELIKQVDALRELKQQTGSTQGSHVLHNGHGDSNRKKEKLSKSTDLKCEKKLEQTAKSNSEKRNKISSVASSSSTDVNSGKRTQSNSGSSTFGGMKKGFLFGGAPKTKPVQENKTNDVNESKSNHSETAGKQNKTGRNKTLEDIPYVKKNEGAKTEQLRFSEVQEAMEKTNSKLMENKDWVTDDLLNKLEKNEKLTKRLQDPKFIQAIGDFQKNPTEALQKYGDNAEIQEFLKDFCGLMGEHFTKLGDQHDSSQQSSLPSHPQIVTADGTDLQVRSSTNPHQPTASDEAKMQEILSDQEIRVILMDPQIQDLFQHLRNNPEKGQRILQTAGGELKHKIHKLVQAGLLQFQQS